jgi:hypothetical protein
MKKTKYITNPKFTMVVVVAAVNDWVGMLMFASGGLGSGAAITTYELYVLWRHYKMVAIYKNN